MYMVQERSTDVNIAQYFNIPAKRPIVFDRPYLLQVCLSPKDVGVSVNTRDSHGTCSGDENKLAVDCFTLSCPVLS